MRIDNGTRYRTKDLRAMVVAGLKATGTDAPRVVVFAYNRKIASAWHGGWARYDGTWMKLTVPRPIDAGGSGINVTEMARTMLHEMRHLRGFRHREMDCGTVQDSGPVVWAEGFTIGVEPLPLAPLRVVMPPEQRAQRRAEGQAKAAERREARAREALAEAEAKLRRLQRRVSMLRAKVRYYDRKAVARPC